MIGVQCTNCLYMGNGTVCLAFPDGIPEEILAGKVDHSNPYNGDNGILFKSLFPTQLEDTVQEVFEQTLKLDTRINA